MQEIINGDCLIEMAKMKEHSIDFIVTDPPYGLKFMGKQWDQGVPGSDFWKEALRICKPGSMMAAFGGSRTHHRLMCAIEDAGWEIRDVVMYLYGSGFPKSHNHFGFKGYGTALKPAYEPIIIAMAPLDGTFKQNAEKWGVAGINIDESRIDGTWKKVEPNWGGRSSGIMGEKVLHPGGESHSKGRWPANLLLDSEAAELLDEQTGIQASRFFYTAKASSSERNRGLEGMPLKENSGKWGFGIKEGRSVAHQGGPQQNNHPTVKPLSLMKYLLKLLAPPGDPIVLDLFCGSGSTLVAAKELGIRSIGIEKSEEYCKLARARVAFEQKEKFMQYELAL